MFPSRIDPRSAAEQRKRIEGNIPTSLLQRLSKAVSRLDKVEADLSFHRDEQGRYRVAGSLEAELQMQCQRCMQDYQVQIKAPVDAVVVWSDEQARQTPADLDPWIADEHMELLGVVEDELLLSLPAMPVHQLDECSGPARYSSQAEEETAKKPFAGLEVLKKSSETNT